MCVCVCVCVCVGLVGRVFTNGPGDLGSIPGHVIPKTLKMVLDTPLLNIQQYKVRIKGKMEQSSERSSLSVVAIEKGALWSLSTNVANFIYFTLLYIHIYIYIYTYMLYIYHTYC